MREYAADGLILAFFPAGDYDGRFSIFTKRFGKLYARGTSVRKITSKLIGHLQPGDLSSVRLVERHGLRVVDALKKERLNLSAKDLYFLDKILPEGEPEEELWSEISEKSISNSISSGNETGEKNGEIRNGSDFKIAWKKILRILGWDPAHAHCANCGTVPSVFNIRAQDFYCAKCAFKAREDELIYL